MGIRINILIENNPYFESSASANRWLTLIEGLHALGCTITLMMLEGYHTAAERNELGTEGVFKGINYRYITQSLQETLWQRRWHKYIGRHFTSGRIKKQVAQIVKTDSAAIYWTSDSYIGFQLAALIKDLSPETKTFLEMSEYLDIHKYNIGNAAIRKHGELRQRYFEEKAMYAYDGIALMTKALVAYASGFPRFEGKILHLPMTVDLDRFAGSKKIIEGFKPPYLVYIGAMNNQKDGIDILIQAFANLKTPQKDLKLYLVGPENYETKDHLAMIDQLGLKNKVFYKGPYSKDSIPSIVCNANGLVLPRPDSKQAQGGFPTKLGEYLASGNPVCATTVGEIPLYLTDQETVYFAAPGDVNSFTQALSKMEENSALAEQVGLAGQEIARKNFNKKIQSNSLFDFLNSL